MVIVRLIGGLGNQMFQYAAARRIAIVNNEPLKLDLSWYGETGDWTSRKFELDIFNTSFSLAAKEEIKLLMQSKQNMSIKKIINSFRSNLLHTSPSHITEKSFCFDPEILDLKGNIYLDGYWQSECYFKDIEPHIRSDFTLKAEPSSKNLRCSDEIQSTESISIHIRRGDYVTLTSASTYHGTCNLDYYLEAVQYIKQRVSNPHFYIFSDDIEWVRANFHIDAPIQIMEHNGTDSATWDMWLMSQCKHHIIANSSFSWWGAWLGTSNDKIVVAPQRWFANDNDIKDLFPAGWHTL